MSDFENVVEIRGSDGILLVSENSLLQFWNVEDTVAEIALTVVVVVGSVFGNIF